MENKIDLTKNIDLKNEEELDAKLTDIYKWYDKITVKEVCHLTAAELSANLRFAPAVEVYFIDTNMNGYIIDYDWKLSSARYTDSATFRYAWSCYTDDKAKAKETTLFNIEEFIDMIETKFADKIRSTSIHNIYNINRLKNALNNTLIHNI